MKAVITGIIFLLVLSIKPPLSYADQKQISKPPAQTHNYKVEAGDSLFSIAKKNYGGEKFWTIIWNDNDWISDPSMIQKGWSLKIRNKKPKISEKLNPKLADRYDRLTTPSPTTEPRTDVAGASTQTIGTPGSFDDIYKQAGSRYGIPWEILYGLHLTETGLRDGPISSGYGTGAQGPMQFMSGTWNSYGVDGNGDGTADINNAIDAIYGAANYLSAHGGVEQGLKFYGGDTTTILNAARSRGYSQ